METRIIKQADVTITKSIRAEGDKLTLSVIGNNIEVTLVFPMEDLYYLVAGYQRYYNLTINEWEK